MDRVSRRSVASPVGWLGVEAGADGLRRVAFAEAEAPATDGDGDAAVDAAIAQLGAYFAGERRAFELPLAPEGTAVQRAVWAALAAVPYGATSTYGAVAAQLGKPGGARAVGLANGQNPIAIVVPCHRIIGSGGALTGYGGGLWRKTWLLEHERGAARLL